MKHVKPYEVKLYENINNLTPSQIRFLNIYVDGEWKVNNGLVDINGSFICNNENISSLRKIKFGKVSGDFKINKNRLTSLEGCPKEVGGRFSCFGNKLKNLIGGPIEVGNFNQGGYGYDCSSNLLESLEGAPESIIGAFHIKYNKLTSLEHGPKFIDGAYRASSNNIKTLEYAPKIINGDLSMLENNLESFKGLSKVSFNKNGKFMYSNKNKPGTFIQIQDTTPKWLIIKFIITKDTNNIYADLVLSAIDIDELNELLKGDKGAEYIMLFIKAKKYKAFQKIMDEVKIPEKYKKNLDILSDLNDLGF